MWDLLYLYFGFPLQGRDLSPVTDKIWKRFYQMNFGEESYEEVVRRMNSSNVTFTWKKLYEVIFYFCFTIQEFGVI